MKRKDKINFAKFLISLSFVLVTIGLALDIEKNVLYNPTEKTYVITSTDSSKTISITTIKEDDPKKTNKESINKEEVNNGLINRNKEQKDTTIDDVNNGLKNQIESNYGINIKYGEETRGYNVGGLQINPIVDKSIINQSLNNLNFNMSLYPSHFFTEMKNYGYPLTIYLIKNYSQDNVTGITDSTNNNVIISISTDYSFSESLHHELYHYIEKYIYAKGGRYTTWESLNPSDFKYGNIENHFSYSSTRNDYSYFVNNYAQTDASEDRASTFEYMTMPIKESCFIGSTPIKRKARTICEQINAVFSSVNTNTKEYWERYVY